MIVVVVVVVEDQRDVTGVNHGMEERKKSVIEPFLKIIGGDRRGPSGGGS